MNKDDIKKAFKERFLELREIINAWELISGAPKNEFDDLNQKILSHLYKGNDFDKVARVIDSELTITYGLSTDLEDAKKMTTDIMEWWNSTDKYNEVI